MDQPHSGSSGEQEEFAASYALDSLDEAERTEFARHLNVCDACRELVAEFGFTADSLPDTLEPVQASAGLKQRLLDAAAADISGEVIANPPFTPLAAERRTRNGWFGTLFGSRPQAIAAVFVVVVLGGLIAWNITLQLDSSSDDPAPTFASAEHLYDLDGTDAAPGTSGAVYRANQSVGFLLLHDLPETGDDEVYQAWRIKGSTPLPEDTFRVSSSGSTIVSINADVADADTIGITVEPEGGSETPTGSVLLIKSS